MTSYSAAQPLTRAEISNIRNDQVMFPPAAESHTGDLLFAVLIGVFSITYLLYYPASYSIMDESSTLGLSYAIAHGTVYLEHVGLSTGLPIQGHIISLYSPFHAALFVPALMTRWRLGFAVAAAFFLLGAFTVRGMLKREGLGSEWAVLYFLNPGSLYYSQTLMAAVPAASMGLLGVSLLMRSDARVVLGGLAFGCAVLLHPWMGPLVVVFSAVWLLETGSDAIIERTLKLAIGAAPAVVMLAAYNYHVTGSPVLNAYWLLGHQRNFNGLHFASFAPFYLLSLMIFPLGGLVVLSPRWSKGWSLPTSSAAVLVLASLYYYRDGINFGELRVLPLLAGTIPGQRFLLPVSFLACVPAARYLSGNLGSLNARFYRWTCSAAAALFIASFWSISVVHQNYLRAHAAIQQAVNADVPTGAQVVIVSSLAANFGGCKELAPVYTVRHCLEAVPASNDTGQMMPGAYLMWIGLPGTRAPGQWFLGLHHRLVTARSWFWKADVWIANPRI